MGSFWLAPGDLFVEPARNNTFLVVREQNNAVLYTPWGASGMLVTPAMIQGMEPDASSPFSRLSGVRTIFCMGRSYMPAKGGMSRES